MEDGILDPPSVTEAEREEDSTSMQNKCDKCGETTSKRKKPKDKTKGSSTAHIAALFHHMTSTMAARLTNQDIEEHLKLQEEENMADWKNHGEQKLCAK